MPDDRAATDDQAAPDDPQASDDLVLYETDGPVGVITVNRPQKLNAISPRLMHAWWRALRAAEVDESTSVVVLRSEGRSFCVGFDISGADPEPGQRVYGPDALSRHAMLAEGLEFMLAHWYLRKPVIASVQGHAVGGGCEIAMLCDITIAAANAVFGEPEVRFSDPGPGLIMPWIIGYKRARELHYLGDLIDADTALELGMVNRVVPSEDLRPATMAYAHRMALVAPRRWPRPSWASTGAPTRPGSDQPSTPGSTWWPRSMRPKPRWARSSATGYEATA